MRIDSPISCNAQITGSFTGSFIGDGSGLTGVTAEWDGSHNGNATITGSLTISSNIIVDGTVDGVDVALLSTNYSLTSASAAANAVSITSLSGSAHSQRVALINSLSASADTHLDANISSLSGSAHSQRVALISALSSSVDTHLDANISALSSSAHSQRSAIQSSLSSAYIAADSALSASAHTQRVALDSAQTTANNSLSSSMAASLRAEYVAADTALSSSQKTYIDAKVAGLVDSAPGTLDTLNELAAALGDDPNFATTVSTSIGTKLAKASNLSDLADAATARTNLGVDTKANTWTGVSGDVTISSLGVATVADDSHNHIISNIDGLQTALDAKQAAGTYNTIIGTDTDIAYTGATVLSTMTLTDGVIQAHASRTLTLADLGYTGATDANNYSHPTHPGDDFSVDSGPLTGATVISDIDINVTTDTLGHVTDANGTIATRTLTLADLGYTGATNANYITNNNQLTNGAGYSTTTGTVTSVATSGGLTGGTITSTGTISISSDARPNANQYFGNSGGDYTYYDNTNGLIRWYVNSSEEMRLDASGNLNVDGDVIAYSSTISDSRLKDDKVRITAALEKVEALTGYFYTWNAGSRQGKVDVGVIAQEVEAVLPQIVHEKEMPFIDGGIYKTVDYEKLTALLIEAVKELSAKVKELESK